MKYFLVVIYTFGFYYSFAQNNNDYLNQIKKLAKSGNPQANYTLARIYEEGNLEKRNDKKAFNLYQEAVAGNYDSAKYDLGRCYEKGIGTAIDLNTARNLYEAAATANHGIANLRLGDMYKDGIGIKINQNQAISYYLKANQLGLTQAKEALNYLPVKSYTDKESISYLLFMAQQEDTISQYKVGNYFSKTKQEPATAFLYYQKSADKGYSKSQLALGNAYLKGEGTERNVKMAVTYLIKAANNGEKEADKVLSTLDLQTIVDEQNIEYLKYKAEKGDENVQYLLFKKYLSGQGVERNLDLALKYCQMAVLRDHPKAIMALADIYQQGSLVNQDYKSATKLYLQGAYWGLDTAMYKLADNYENGRGTPENKEYAVRWFLKAANKGHEQAAFRLSKYKIDDFIDKNDLEYITFRANQGDKESMLILGRYYLRQERTEAISWLKKSEEKGNVDAKLLLGDAYLEGKCGLKISTSEAFKYYAQAATKGNAEAVKKLALLYSRNLTGEAGVNSVQMAIQKANQYLAMTQGGNINQTDILIYQILGDTYAAASDQLNAITYYGEFLQRYQKQEVDNPTELIKTLEKRANSYSAINRHENAIADLDLALERIEMLKEHKEIKTSYPTLKGLLLYAKGKLISKTGNNFKACNIFLEAKKMGVEIEKKYTELCQ